MNEKKSEAVVRDIKRRIRRKYVDPDGREQIKRKTLQRRRELNLGNAECLS